MNYIIFVFGAVYVASCIKSISNLKIARDLGCSIYGSVWDCIIPFVPLVNSIDAIIGTRTLKEMDLTKYE